MCDIIMMVACIPHSGRLSPLNLQRYGMGNECRIFTFWNRTPPGYSPGPKAYKGGGAPFETPARGPSLLDPGHPGQSHFPGLVRNLARFPQITAQAAIHIPCLPRLNVQKRAGQLQFARELQFALRSFNSLETFSCRHTVMAQVVRSRGPRLLTMRPLLGMIHRPLRSSTP